MAHTNYARHSDHEHLEESAPTDQHEPAVRQAAFLDEWSHRPGVSPASIWISAGVAAFALLIVALYFGGAFSRSSLDMTDESEIAQRWASRFDLPASAWWIGVAQGDLASATPERPKAIEPMAVVTRVEPKSESNGVAKVPQPEAAQPEAQPYVSPGANADSNPTPPPQTAPRILSVKKGGVTVPMNPESGPTTPSEAASVPTATPREPEVPAWVKETWGR